MYFKYQHGRKSSQASSPEKSGQAIRHLKTNKNGLDL